jgi:hypothetical protein
MESDFEKLKKEGVQLPCICAQHWSDDALRDLCSSLLDAAQHITHLNLDHPIPPRLLGVLDRLPNLHTLEVGGEYYGPPYEFPVLLGVETLHIAYTGYQRPAAVKMMHHLINRMCNIRSVFLNVNLNDMGSGKVATFIQSLQHVRSIHFRCSQPKLFESYIVPALATLKDLKHLDISHIPISSEGLSSLLGELDLETLKVNKVGLKTKGCVAISKYASHSLTRLEMERNNVTASGFSVLLPKLQALRALNVSYNSFSVSKFAHLLPSTLQELNLSKCGLSVADTLSRSLCSRNHDLKVLDLSFNKIGSSAHALLPLIPRLSTLHLDGCGLTDAEVVPILKVSTALQKLTLNLNEVRHRAAEEASRLLQRVTTQLHLQIPLVHTSKPHIMLGMTWSNHPCKVNDIRPSIDLMAFAAFATGQGSAFLEADGDTAILHRVYSHFANEQIQA